MKEKDVDPPSPAMLKALGEAHWERLLPRLAAYAEQRLRRVGWAEGHDTQPNRMSVQEVVNIAIERSLDGSRRWSDDDNPPELGSFLCGVILSLVSDERKKFRRDKVDLDAAAVDAAQDPRETDDAEVGDQEEDRSAICLAVEACAKGDDALELFRLAALDGNTKREDIAASLGWTPDEATAARIKLQRRLVKRFPIEFASIKKNRGTP